MNIDEFLYNIHNQLTINEFKNKAKLYKLYARINHQTYELKNTEHLFKPDTWFSYYDLKGNYELIFASTVYDMFCKGEAWFDGEKSMNPPMLIDYFSDCFFAFHNVYMYYNNKICKIKDRIASEIPRYHNDYHMTGYYKEYFIKVNYTLYDLNDNLIHVECEKPLYEFYELYQNKQLFFHKLPNENGE